MKFIFKFLFSKFLRKRQISYVLKNAPETFVSELKKINSSSVVIDLGANIGVVSEILARTGAKVYSFEPNRDAFSILCKYCKRYPNVEAFQLGAGVKNSFVQLYLHEKSNNSNSDYTQASSLLSSKTNISTDNKMMIYEVDFCDFLNEINCHVDLLKIDIEGYEISLINHLLDSNLIDRVSKIYMETHEQKNPSLTEGTLLLKRRIDSLGLTNKFIYTWH